MRSKWAKRKGKLNRTLILAAVAGAVCLCFQGCGGDEPGPTAPSVQPVVRSVLLQGGFSIDSFHFIRLPFTVVRTGTLDVTVDWTFPSSAIWVYVAQGPCSAEQFRERFSQDTCNFLIRSESTAPKPRVIESPGATQGNYILFISNRSEAEESITYSVGATS